MFMILLEALFFTYCLDKLYDVSTSNLCEADYRGGISFLNEISWLDLQSTDI